MTFPDLTHEQYWSGGTGMKGILHIAALTLQEAFSGLDVVKCQESHQSEMSGGTILLLFDKVFSRIMLIINLFLHFNIIG